MLHSKYISCWPHSFREDFKRGFFSYKSIETLNPGDRPVWTPDACLTVFK